MSVKPFWVRGGHRYIVNHPEDIREILAYLKRYGDLRANAIYVERLWYLFSKKSGTNWRAVTELSLEGFADYLENGIDEATYYSVVEGEWNT